MSNETAGFREFIGGMQKLTKALNGRMTTDRVLKMLEHADEHYMKANEQMRGILGNKFSIDEMALYFPEEKMLLDFVKRAVQNGWRLFNIAEDNVTTRPIIGAYTVEYWFLERPGKDYRLELMWLPEEEGFSPYHASLHNVAKTYRTPALAHASFKVLNDLEYGNALFHFRQAGYDVLQNCESGYGKFSYLRADNDVPLKPRINLRDGSNESA